MVALIIAASRLQEILAKKSGDGASPSGGHVPRKKKSRWSNEDDLKTVIPGLSTIMPTGLSKTQQEAYLGKPAIRIALSIIN